MRYKGGRKERMGKIEGIALTYLHCHVSNGASLVAQMIKNLLAMRETRV